MNRTTRLLLGLALAGALTAAACSSSSKSSTSTSGSSSSAAAKPTITIGAQDFGESAILAEIYRQGLEAKGFTVSIQKLGGFRDLEITAFGSGTINFAPEYAASMLEALNNHAGEATSDKSTTIDKLNTQLTSKGLAALDASDAVDTNSFVVTKATADRLGLKTLSDLASKGASLKLGALSDCAKNAFCLPGLKRVYNLDLSANVVSLESGQIVDTLTAGTVDVGVLDSTNGQILAKNLVLLQDDKKMLAADNVLPIVKATLTSSSDLVAAANAITKTLTTDELIKLNKSYDVDKEDAAVIAKDYLTSKGLI